MSRDDVAHPDPSTAPGLGRSKSRVLAVLQESGGDLGVQDVAERVGLHPNTTRFHLDALVEAGIVERAVETRDQPGRPRTLYTAKPESQRVGQRSYRLLAEILAGFMAAEIPRPAAAARRAGEAWGRFLADRPVPFRRVDAAGATRQLVATLDEIGFAPEPVTRGRKRQILLHHCPFRETAEAHREVACSVHLGLMQGMLDDLDAPLGVDRLDAFVEPQLCVTHLSRRPTQSAPRRGTSRDS